MKPPSSSRSPCPAACLRPSSSRSPCPAGCGPPLPAPRAPQPTGQEEREEGQGGVCFWWCLLFVLIVHFVVHSTRVSSQWKVRLPSLIAFLELSGPHASDEDGPLQQSRLSINLNPSLPPPRPIYIIYCPYALESPSLGSRAFTRPTAPVVLPLQAGTRGSVGRTRASDPCWRPESAMIGSALDPAAASEAPRCSEGEGKVEREGEDKVKMGKPKHRRTDLIRIPIKNRTPRPSPTMSTQTKQNWQYVNF